MPTTELVAIGVGLLLDVFRKKSELPCASFFVKF